MLNRELLTDETPLSNPERLAAWREKVAGWSLERWYELAHPEAPALQVEDVRWRNELPSLLRRQAG
jgi:hypothetical protein